MEPSKKITLTLLIVVFFIILLRTAWVSDDSYITMRTIDNFVNGYGLTWNPGERVQTYTHPLWMMILLVVFSITHHAYGSIIFSSIFFSVSTIFLVLCRDKDELIIFIGWCMLIFSNAFIDFSTSGLENPATHLLLVVFGFLYLQTKQQLSNKRLIAIGIFMGLAVLNRMDLILLVFPSLIEISFRKEVRRKTWLVIAGFAPLIIWEVFSIIYYGFPFPNTYYAKLHTGIAERALIKQGIMYFFNSLAWDPITLSIIGTALLLSFYLGNRQQKMVAVGIVMYLAYIIWIGGDFMSGRYFSAPFILSVLLLMQFLKTTNLRAKTVVLIVIVFLGSIARTPSFSPPLTRDDALENLTGVSDEQAYYYSGTGLLRWGTNSKLPRSHWIDEGRQLQQSGEKVFVGGGIGFLGFNAGPDVHVIDHFALSDPLLSHLPVANPEKFLIGHFRRTIPKGYIETLESGNNQIEDPYIAEFYNKIKLITQGTIWNVQRWETIWRMNTGQYRYLLN